MEKKEPIEEMYLDDEDMKAATIVTKEGRKSWTYRGDNLVFDKSVIRGAVKANPVASRIFLTGEVHMDYIGMEGFNFLAGIDRAMEDTPIAPLFIETRNETIRMSRYDPEFVWREIEPNALMEMAKSEIERLHIEMDYKALEYFDFYQSMIWYMKQKNGDYCVPTLTRNISLDTHYHITYLTCLLLFNKSGYMGTHAAEFFANPTTLEFMKDMEYRVLKREEQKEVNELRKRCGRVPALTSKELMFAVRLYKDK